MTTFGAFRKSKLASTSVLAVTLAAGLTAPASADSVHWSGGISNNWFTDGNWVWDGHTPDADDTAQIDSTGAEISGSIASVGSLFVGVGNGANLTIDSDLASLESTLGYNAGSIGTISIGIGANWINTGNAYVGNNGAGNVYLGSSASATIGELYLGAGSTGAGTVSVGFGSTLDVTGTTYVGYAGGGGDGTLTVNTGSDVTSGYAVVADGIGSTGLVTIDGSGSTWDVTDNLVVGGGGVGKLTVSDGGALTSGESTIGNLTSSSGSSATVTGTDSSWSVDGALFVGGTGNAGLTVEDGGSVSSDWAYVGYNTGSTSSVTIDGSGSEFEVINSLLVGNSGTGTLTVSNSATATVGSAFFGFNADSNGSALIDDATLTVTDRIGVGYSGTGDMTIINGATVSANGAIVGWNGSGSGEVTVSGSGSTWDNTGTLYVGNLGDGILTVSDSATVISTDGYVGTEDGSDSSALVTGAGSSWDMSGAFFVGHNDGAVGSVTIADGGSISGLQGILGDLAGSSGTMTVTGSGSVWEGVVDAGVLYSGDLNVGRFGTGQLTVSDGGLVTGNRLHIANEAGSSGTAVVTGSGSSIDIADQLSVGLEGDGTLAVRNHASVTVGDLLAVAAQDGSTGSLDIASGGDVTSYYGIIADASGAVGHVTVDGTGSSLDIDDALIVGYEGVGTLDVSSGATVTVGLMAVGMESTADGSALSVTGAGSSLTAENLAIGVVGDATFDVSNDATVNVDTLLTIANLNGSSGSMDIASGGSVTSQYGVIGDMSGTTGRVTVDGVGSDWSISKQLIVGGEGVGTLDVSNGATVTADVVSVGISLGGSAVTVTGAESSLNAERRLSLASDANLTVTEGGSVTGQQLIMGDYYYDLESSVMVDAATLAMSEIIEVGYWGSSDLKVQNGGTVTSKYVAIGEYWGGIGTVSVLGAGSALAASEQLLIGLEGDGTVTVANGGELSAGEIILAAEDGSSGTLNIGAAEGDAAAAAGTIDTDTIVFGYGEGEIIFNHTGSAYIFTADVSGDGSLSFLSGNTSLSGNYAGFTGTIGVDGADLAVDTAIYAQDVTVSDGSVRIAGGSMISSDRGTLGNDVGSTAAMTVTGFGSAWAGDLTVGNAGTGTLTIADSGTVVAPQLLIATRAGSTGTVNVGAARGDTASMGYLDADEVVFGEGDGSLVFNHTSSAYDFDADVSGDGALAFLSGTTNLSGDYTDFVGSIEVDGGYLSVDTDTLSVVTRVLEGATIGGTGRLGNVEIADGGTIAPGNSIGTLTVADISLAAGSTYAVEVDEDGNSDLIDATGTATIDSGATVTVSAENGTDDGSTYSSATTYTILSADGGVTGTFGSVSDNLAFLDSELSYDALNVYLTLLRNGVDFSDLATSSNQRAVAAALETLAPGSALYDAILALGDDEAAGAFDTLSGEIHASAQGMLVDDSHYVRDAINNRLIENSATASGSGASAFWMSSFGAWASADGNGNAASLDHNTGGFVAGVDTSEIDNWTLGLAGGYSQTSFDVNDRTSSGTSDNYSIGLYGGSDLGPVALRLGGAFTWHQLDSTRAVDAGGLNESLKAEYDAATTQIFGEAGYRIDAGPIGFEPFAGLAYVHLHTDGITETGGDAALSSGSDSFQSTFTTIGLRSSAAFDIGGTKAIARGMLGWRHAFGDATPDKQFSFVGSDSFTISGVPIARDVAAVEAGLDFAVTQSASVGFSYSGQFGSGDYEQQIKGRFDVKF